MRRAIHLGARVVACGLVVGACAQPADVTRAIERPEAPGATPDASRTVQQARPRPFRSLSPWALRDPAMARTPGVLRTWSPWLNRDVSRWRVRYEVDVEAEIKRLTDQARALDGNTSALQRNDSLRDIARAHSRDMAAREAVSPTRSDGTAAADWLRAAGITYSAVGVSVHRIAPGIYAAHDTLRDRLDGWLNRPDDRARLLSPRHYDTGVGVFKGPDGNLYITMIVRQPTFVP
jgi:uncharacterized protein YkwD